MARHLCKVAKAGPASFHQLRFPPSKVSNPWRKRQEYLLDLKVQASNRQELGAGWICDVSGLRGAMSRSTRKSYTKAASDGFGSIEVEASNRPRMEVSSSGRTHGIGRGGLSMGPLSLIWVPRQSGNAKPPGHRQPESKRGATSGGSRRFRTEATGMRAANLFVFCRASRREHK